MTYHSPGWSLKFFIRTSENKYDMKLTNYISRIIIRDTESLVLSAGSLTRNIPMLLPYSLLLALPSLFLLSAGLIPNRWANHNFRAMRRGTVMLLVVALGCSAVATVMLRLHGPLDVALLTLPGPVPLNLGVYFDSLSAVMLLLISFIGLIIVRYSLQYLDGEATQGRFLRWIMLTLGAVLLLVVSRNLVMFTAAWMLTSLGLHKLLTHYPDRPWALWAARKKFLISRLGDLLLIAALALTFYCFGSFNYSDVFAAAQALRENTNGGNWLVSVIGTLYVLGAMTKSAQLPFHSWLPDTMETPTPVSALMHAGIINAGGFLIIRLSPLVSLSHLALDFLALVGACTALFGGVVMLTQTSIKRSLAYSTIAQMGFMMLQCGLGAFSAALLHIVAHSLYKAHAFLSSGSVLDSATHLKTEFRPILQGGRARAALPVAITIAVCLCGSAGWLLGVDYETKPGALILGLILAIALTHLLWPALASGSWRLASRGIVAGAMVSGGYIAAFLLTDRILASSVSHQLVSPSLLGVAVIVMVAAGFIGVFALQAVADSLSHLAPIRSLYVHAANGFYFDIPARSLTARFWGRTAPVP
jgi:NAD(P)H-quinone oxidoreductase subunit 5